MKRLVLLAAVWMSWANAAVAQPVIDGTAEELYGTPLSIQNTRTHYGDGSGNPDVIMTRNAEGQGGGSEIDQVFATVADGRLYVTITGNLEENFNKLNVFIDSTGGGVNQLSGANLPGGLDSFCCGQFPPPKGGNVDNVGALQKMSGLKFDNAAEGASATFTADYALIFTHGGERVNENLPNDVEFWALSAHFADLTQGSSGAVGGLGMQLGPRGEPRLLRGPGDYSDNGTVDAADYTVWRDTEGAGVPNGVGADGNANGSIDTGDYDTWKANFSRDTSIAGDAYKPFGNPGNTEALIGPTLPGLGQGELIDRTYALGAGGCDDDTGAGCLAKELEFALDVDPNEINAGDPAQSNASSHRNFNNFVDLRMAINNSNIVGVRGSGGPDFGIVPGEDDPSAVVTGIEFSIPLSQIGNPTGDIRLLAFVGNGSFDHMSNQVSGEGVLEANVGGAFYGAAPVGSFNDLPGDQFVTAMPGAAAAVAGVPEPSAVVLAIVGSFLACVLRKRK